MRVYVVRHGDAAATEDESGERPLTDAGIEEALSAGGLLSRESPQYILCSPKLRTRQTAERIAAACENAELLEDESLLPPSSGNSVAAAIDRCGGEAVVLVSHLPLVAELVAWFCTGDERDYALSGFPPGGVIALDMEHCGIGAAELSWHAFPPDFEVVS
jgi:phosphohistidine phosphatase